MKFFQKIFTIKNVSLLVIAIGVILRVEHYIENRSFWLDESWLALHLSIIHYADIFAVKIFSNDLPLPPPGFLLIQKFFLENIINNEWALRLFPLVCGVSSIFVFKVFVKKYLGPIWQCLALSFFVFSQLLIHYSAELKQYSSDVLIAILLLLMLDDLLNKKLSLIRVLFYGLASAVFVWISYTAVFVLSGASLVILLFHIAKRNFFSVRRVSIFMVVWITSFVKLYIDLKEVSNNAILKNVWQHTFLPQQVFSWETIHWLEYCIKVLFADVVGFFGAGLPAIIFLLGVYKQFKKQPVSVLFLVSPLVVVFLAAAMHKYPFVDRMVLFIFPVLTVFIFKGLEYIQTSLPKRGVIISCVVFGMLLFNPIRISINYFMQNQKEEGMRQVMEVYRKNARPDDAIYLSNDAQYAFGYYNGTNDSMFKNTTVPIGKIVSINDGRGVESMQYVHNWFYFNQKGFLKGRLNFKNKQVALQKKKEAEDIKYAKRIWVIMTRVSHVHKEQVLEYFQNFGTEILIFKKGQSEIYLFDTDREKEMRK